MSNAITPVDIAASGLLAQRTRMDVIAGNIANSSTNRTPGGGPYRRREVVLSTDGDLAGVKVDRVVEDMTTELKRIYRPGSPYADADGFVEMPNVDLPTELMDLTVANRAYQANTAVLRRYGEIMDVTLELLR